MGFLCQRSQGEAEIVLGRGPIERHALAGADLESGAIGSDGLFQNRPFVVRSFPYLFTRLGPGPRP